jgi:hypothetical protein
VPDAVVGDAGVGVGAGGGQEGQQAAQAIADRADLAVDAGQGADGGDGGGDVRDAGVDVEGVVEFEGPLPLGLALVGDVDARLDAPEQVGADGDEALGGQAVADVAHHLVDAEDLLDDDDGRAGGRRRARHIGREGAVGRGDREGLAHGALLRAGPRGIFRRRWDFRPKRSNVRRRVEA